MKRLSLFLITNLAVIVVLMVSWAILSSVFGLDQAVSAQGINVTSLIVFSLVFGFGGAFISLFMSKWMAKFSTRAKVIAQPQSDTEAWLLAVVERQAQEAGIKMPQVAIYPSSEVNAFATGPSRNNALVAVSQGLLEQMTRDEAEAVLGHEIGHVANGDMVTLTLIQGVVNAFVIFFARVAGYFIDRVVLRNEEGLGIGYWVGVILAEILFGILASTITLWFSRQREFRADLAGAKLADRQKMINALKRLQQMQEPSALPSQMAALGISGRQGGSWRRLFMSHPPLEERIAALEALR